MNIRRSGFIAQEVEQAALKAGYNFSGLIKPRSSNEHYSLSYDAFVVPLVKAVQEQQTVINAQHLTIHQQKAAIEQQRIKIEEMEKRLSRIEKLLEGSE
jgi:trimeric autotransporter adhesin